MELEWRQFKYITDYDEIYNLMSKQADLIASNQAQSQIWLLEHHDVYTAGTSAVQDDLINHNNVPIKYIGRGGKFTYHGPGQRIIYLLINLRKFFNESDVDIRKFVSFLENWIINLLQKFGIISYKIEGRIGIWVNNYGKEEKIAAIGIRVTKGVTYHGISVNINPNLDMFNGIVPCGIRDAGVTSIFKSANINKDYADFIEEFDILLKEAFYETYNDEFGTQIYKDNI